MTFLRSLPDRWRCWWSSDFHALADARDENVRLAREIDALHEASVQAVEVIDLYRDRNQRLCIERDRAVRDLHDVLGLRARNDVTSMLEENE